MTLRTASSMPALPTASVTLHKKMQMKASFDKGHLTAVKKPRPDVNLWLWWGWSKVDSGVKNDFLWQEEGTGREDTWQLPGRTQEIRTEKIRKQTFSRQTFGFRGERTLRTHWTYKERCRKEKRHSEGPKPSPRRCSMTGSRLLSDAASTVSLQRLKDSQTKKQTQFLHLHHREPETPEPNWGEIKSNREFFFPNQRKLFPFERGSEQLDPAVTRN